MIGSTRRVAWKYLVSSTALLGLAATSASAQQAARKPADKEENAAGPSDDWRLEEVIVTAQRRDQRLTDVPASVAAVDAETIRDLNVQQLSELGAHVPNLQIDSSSSLNSAVYIRGVGANSRNIGFDTRVGVYLDGVYLGQSPALNQELVDLERVEVLRGPQGALFGKNTVAGAINLISRQPAFERDVFLSARVGNYEGRQGMVRWNQPLSDSVAAKVSLNYAARDGFTINTLSGDTLGDRDVLSWRGQVRWDVGDASRILASVDGLRARESGEFGNAFTNTFGSALSAGFFNPRTVELNHLNRDERDIHGASLDASHEFGNGLTLKSITSYRRTKFFSSNDLDYSPLDLLSIDFSDKYDQWTQEFQVTSPSGERFEYVAGLYLYAQDSTTTRTALAHSLAPLLGVADGATLDTAGTVETRNVALYGNGEYDLTDRLTIGAGFRYSWEEKDVEYLIDSSRFAVLRLATGTFQDTRSDSVFSPTLTARYAITPGLVAFVRYAEGYKSGGYNLDFISADSFPGGLEFREEIARSFEAGLKGDLMNRRLNFSLTGFRTVFDDFQVDQFQDMGDGVISIIIGNASEVESQGAELETVLSVNSQLRFNLGIGYQDVTFASFPGGGAGGIDATGQRVPGAARWQTNFGADYSVPMGNDFELKLHTDYTYRSSYYSDIGNVSSVWVGGVEVPYDRIKPAGLVNARIALTSLNQNWEAALWSRNLLDHDHVFIYGGDFFGTGTRRFAPPRTWGLELSARF